MDRKMRRSIATALANVCWFAATPLAAQQAVTAQSSSTAPLRLGGAGYYEAPGVNWLVFSNWYDGLFADAKMSGVELIQQDVRTVTNGDV
ncbi:hypothetical protein, partial [uncultured Sphingomonas sp.]|uniref:hypothetical protein n=1 Tax=uncultured Sphingomonas sp. TaxID=158754 RepID=UPI0035CBF7FE